jgi:hypothetical protein
MHTKNEIVTLQRKLTAANEALERWARKMNTFMHYWQDGIRGTGSSDGPREAEEVCGCDFLGLADEEDGLRQNVMRIEKRLLELGAPFEAPETTAQRLKGLMNEAEVSPKWMAEQTMFSVKTVLRHLNGETQPDIETLRTYARVLSGPLNRTITASELRPQ